MIKKSNARRKRGITIIKRTKQHGSIEEENLWLRKTECNAIKNAAAVIKKANEKNKKAVGKEKSSNKKIARSGRRLTCGKNNK